MGEGEVLDQENILRSLSFEKSPLEGQEDIVIVHKVGKDDSYLRDPITESDALVALKHLQKIKAGKNVLMGLSISTPKAEGAATDALIFVIK